MKRLTFIGLLLLFSLVSFSQTDIGFHLQQLEKTSDPEIKLNALDSILSISERNEKLDDFIRFSEEYITLAKSLKKYDLAAKKAIDVSYSLHIIKNQPLKSIELIDGILPFYNQLTDTYLKGGLYLKRGGAYYEIDLNKAIADYTSAIEIYADKDALYKADAHLFRGQAYSSLGQFVPASEDFNAAYILFEKEKDYEYMLHAKSGEIIMYSKNNFTEKAQEQRQKLINELKDLKLYQYLSTQYFNQSLDYKKIKRIDLQEEMLLKSLEFADSTDNKNFIYLNTHSSLAQLNFINNNIQKGLYHLDIAEANLSGATPERIANSVFLNAVVHYQIAKKDYKGAEENSLKRLGLLQNTGHDEEWLNTLLVLSDIYEKLNQEDKALYHFRTYSKIKDSLYSQSKTNALIYYQTLYETERNEKALVEKKGDIALLEQKNTSIKKQFLYGGAAITMGFVLLFLYKSQRDLKSKKAMNEKFTQDLMQAQEEERKRVSKDLHDGLGQSLLLIKNKVVLNRDEDTKSMVENAIEEVRSISRALHPFQLQEMGITKAIESILYQFDETTDLFISTEIDPIDNLFETHQEVNIYRIVQESLNNVLKHANASAVKVKIEKEHNSIDLLIQDNGVGFDFSERYNDFKTLGLKTLKERTRYLNGIMKIDSQTNIGTKLEYKIPFKNVP